MRTLFFARAAAGAAAALVTVSAAHASLAVDSGSYSYFQDFDSLAASGTNKAWANDATLAGWSLFNKDLAALTTYSANDGGSNTGSFYSYGTSGSTDRALGGLGSGGTYFGSPASAATAGWIAVSFRNDTGSALAGFTVGFDGEQWRNGGNTSAQTMVLQYGFGSSFASVANWTSAGAGFDWTSPVTGATAASVNGNVAGLVSGVGGTVQTAWAAGDTLWPRWIEANDVGNDHGLAIDDFSLTVTAVPEPETYALMLAGLGLIGAVVRRRRAGK